MKNTRTVDTKLRLQVLEILNELKIDPKTGVEIFEAILAGKKFNINKNEATASKIFKQQALSLQSKIAEKEINIEEAGNSIITFADPTFDSTFKILFGTNNNKDILISLLNSLLDFKDENKIKSLEITTDKILGNIFSYTPQKQSLHGAVDILCTTENNKKIAIEMQRAKKSYSLARTQEYMSKLISMQLKTSDSNEHDKKLLDTYILTIDKDNLFTGEKHSLVNRHIYTGGTIDTNLYEIEVEPIIKQTGQVFLGNKMH